MPFTAKFNIDSAITEGVRVAWTSLKPPGTQISKATTIEKRDLAKFIDKEVIFDKFKQYRQLSKILEELPKDVILAGGFVLSLIHSSRANDIDLFFGNARSFKTAYELLTTKFKFEYKDLKNRNIVDVFMDKYVHEIKLYPTQETYNSGISNDLKLPIQLLKTRWFKDAPVLLNTFDFTVNQLAISNANIYFGKRTLNDVKNNKLVPYYLAKGAKAIYRITKYYRKGFEMESKLLSGIFKASIIDNYHLDSDALSDLRSLIDSLERAGYGSSPEINSGQTMPTGRPIGVYRTPTPSPEPVTMTASGASIPNLPMPGVNISSYTPIDTTIYYSHNPFTNQAVPAQPTPPEPESSASPTATQWSWNPQPVTPPTSHETTEEALNRLNRALEQQEINRFLDSFNNSSSDSSSEEASEPPPSDNITF
ncbi:MAG: hypothetical protein KGO96_07265 [Elusimicrobia bacterium]|nr:hypothetical protein [Elusimicrobiota bacterium]